MTEAIAEVPRNGGPKTTEGPKALGQRPPRPWRALLARRGRRRPLSHPDQAVLQNAESQRAGKRGSRFLFRPTRPDLVTHTFYPMDKMTRAA
ncbi:hypothetical protein AP071_09840 [Rhodobacter capsulatus]|nr:hypothetical protein AP071_09840 [Rhodobacter capsulatus]